MSILVVVISQILIISIWKDAKFGTNKTQIVNIKNQPGIHVLYWTTWTDDSEVVQFRTDIYNRDSNLNI